MAKRMTALEKTLAAIDQQIADLQRSRALVVAAMPKAKVKKPTPAPGVDVKE